MEEIMSKKIQHSLLQKERYNYRPQLPLVLKNSPSLIKASKKAASCAVLAQEKIKEVFQNTCGLDIVSFKKGANSGIKKQKVKVGVVLSGGQAPGGHNVISGIFDCLQKANKNNVLIGYLGGPSGILENKYETISKARIDEFRNTGGFDLIRSGRTKIETQEQLETAKDNLLKDKLDSLIIIGGDDSNTNAAVMAEFIKSNNIDISVIGVPKTIDGDLKNQYIETSFGFDTATKIYAELAGNVCRDAKSSQKYWHFIRLMGRNASHITLEVGFKVQPNIVLIGEEIKEKQMTLSQVVDYICDIIAARSFKGKNFGIIFVPEGLIEFIPEFKELISSLNEVLSNYEKEIDAALFNDKEKKVFVSSKLSESSAALLNSLPHNIAMQLLLDRDPHGNVVVSQIETEKLLIEMVENKLDSMKAENKYNGKFSAISHFLGYEGRCGIPSNFDANYSYALGYTAALLALNKFNGYMSCVGNLTKAPIQWTSLGIPLVMMMGIERRKGKDKPVIKKAMVDLQGKPFKAFEQMRKSWAQEELYIFPGPIQYFGSKEITDTTTQTLIYERKK
jgi:pyrophosphate--fructose-6-phosphate 1-phosphotransferase